MKRRPQRGLPKPPPKDPVTMRTTSYVQVTRMANGVYHVNRGIWGRSGQWLGFNTTERCVMNDFGDLVVVGRFETWD